MANGIDDDNRLTFVRCIIWQIKKIRRETADFLSRANDIDDDNRLTFVHSII